MLLELYMGHTNGQLNSRQSQTVGEKGDKGDKGDGFKLTQDNHFDLDSRRLTNLETPVDDADAVTKKKLTPYPEVINIKLLPTISIHSSANR